MIPMDTIIAMAVASAAINTEVRRSDAPKLRDANKASAPKCLPIQPDATRITAETNAGIASAHETIRKIAAR